MYNVKSNYGLAILSSLALVASVDQVEAQQRSIINQSFEEFAPGFTPSVQTTNTPPSAIVGWESVAASDGSPNFIEYWSDGFLGQASRSGNFYVELNPSVPVFIYQEVCLLQNELLSWGFSHAGRVGGPNPQAIQYSVRDASNNVVQVLDTSSVSPNGVWSDVSNTGVFSGASGIYRIGFVSTNSGGAGNFLDDISIQPIALTEFQSPPTQGLENTNATLPEIVISGVVTEETIITLSIAGAAGPTGATVGDDFTIDNNTITIPAGTYDGSSASSRFSAPITILNDSVVESAEVIDISVISVTSSATGLTSTTLQTGDIQCSGAPEASTTHTILDAEPEIDVSSSNGPAPIADGGEDDFGNTTTGVEQTVTYTITNNGNDDLVLGTPVVDAGAVNVTGVSVGAPGASTLAPGESTTITVTYTPVAPGDYDFAISVPNNDPDENPYNIDLTGVAFAPPTADDEESLGNAIGTAPVIDVLDGDVAAAGRTIDEDSIRFVDPATGDPVTSVTVNGQGTWTINGDNDVVFTPVDGFAGPTVTPVDYTIADDLGGRSEPAEITVSYTPAPTADDDGTTGNAIGSAPVIDVLDGDVAATGRTIDEDSIRFVDPVTGDPVTSVTVADEGTWTINGDNDVVFTPVDGFTGPVTPVDYTVADDQGNRSAPAEISVGYTGTPTADDDESLGNAIGSAPVVDVLDGDVADTGRTIDEDSIRFVDPVTGDPVTSVTVADEGTWTINGDNDVVFTPVDGFTGPVTPVDYTVADDQGNRSAPAEISVGYTGTPTADDDESLGNAIGSAPVVDVLDGDVADTGRTIDEDSIRFVDPVTGDPVTSVTVADEGTWTINGDNDVVFTPVDGFTGPVTPVDYTVADDQGNRSAPAEISVGYTGTPTADDDESLGNAIGSAPVVDVLDGDVADTGRTIDEDSIRFVDPVTGDPVTSVTVADEGTWTINGDNDVVFTPVDGFTGPVTPVDYTVADDQGNRSAPAEISVGYTGAPTADDDESLGNAIGTAPVVDVLDGDVADAGRTIDEDSVRFVDPVTGDPVTSVTVADEGTWTINGDNDVVFTPVDGFAGPVTPVEYTVADDQGNRSAPAEINVAYTGAPTALPDESMDNEIGQPVSLAVLENDSADAGRTLDPTSVRLIDPATGDPVTTIVIDGQGTWSVTPAGVVTFTPVADFTGSPAPVSYTVDDDQGNTSAPATITVGYEPAVNIEVIEAVLSDDLLQTTTMLSGNASRISRRAADRLNVSRGQACGDEINELLRSNPVQFATDKFFIDERNNAVLDRIVTLLNECPSARFTIAGHTDSRASDAYNIVLSQNRVDAVKSALIQRGIASERLDAEGFGESRPIATNATVEGMALNRRVEFMLREGEELNTRPCGDADQPRRTLDGASDGATARLNGSYRSNGYDCVTDYYHEAWAEVSVTHEDDRGTLGMLSFGMSRERQADNRLFGQFIEGYLSKSDVDTPEANGTITGVGIHAGLFGANATEGGLILSYYGSAAIGHHSFELETIETADGSYTYGGLFAGGAIGGEREYEDMILKPRVGIDLAYAVALGSEISVPDVELDIDPATYARAFAELGVERTLDNGDLVQFAPRAFCAISGTNSSEDCGFGAIFSYETMTSDSDVYWDVTADYEQIGDRQTATLSAARSVSIFNGLGVSKSSFGASGSGAIEVGQHAEFAW